MKAFPIIGSCGLILALSGCVLSQQEPPPKEIQNAEITVGTVQVEDYRGMIVGARALAFFQRAKRQTQIERPSYVSRIEALVNSGYECQSQTVESTSGETETTFLDAGNVTLGSALGGGTIPMDKSDKNRYRVDINSNYPAGLYEVQASGTSSVPGFKQAYLSLPEVLEDGSVNGTRFEDGGVISVNAPLRLSWRAPAYQDKNNFMYAEISVPSSETALQIISCGVEEKAFFGGDSYYNWEIAQNWLANLPVGKSANILLVRAHKAAVQGDSLYLLLNGMRLYYGMALLQ